jgi:regulator of sirC expression with transglutaminase-like and TPR domain
MNSLSFVPAGVNKVLVLLGLAGGLGAVFSSAVGEDTTVKLSRIGAEVQKSVVQIHITDQQGQEKSVGAGFAVDQPGFIATNLHVIGEGRSFVVRDVAGKQLTVTTVVASDRLMDLAILQVSQTHLTPLELADFSKVKKGQPFVAIGHPQGLKNSMVQGIISSRRPIDGREMLQIAMPVEPGNSGGPVVNLEGKVVGTVTLKSVATNNIGFAVGVDQIKKMIEAPNPIQMSQWLKIGVLAESVWKPLLGGSWRKSGGRIFAHSAGEGFGGRTICVYQKPLPEMPYEFSVDVRLKDESGAAGLCFLVDEKNWHYGFYPSNSKIRMSRFEGDTPLEWTVLDEQVSALYRSGQWNQLKIRVEEDRISGFVNDGLVLVSKDRKVSGPQIGLAKFRETAAEFRNFRVGKKLVNPVVPPEIKKELMVDLDREMTNENFEKILERTNGFSVPSRQVILNKAKALEQQVVRMRLLAQSVHLESVKNGFQKVISKKENDINLIEACLWIARADDPDHEIKGYLEQFDRLAEEFSRKAESAKTDLERIKVLNRFLFEENGFHGSRHDYYRPENSYVSHVLEDREGIPITLSILYIELARKIGLSIDGVGLPGHFVVSMNMENSSPQLIDVFAGGQLMSLEDAKFLVASTTALNWDTDYLKPVSKKQILGRVVQNLRAIAERKQDNQSVLRYLELLHVIDPDDVSIKGARAVFLFQSGWQNKAIRELDEIIKQRPSGLDLRMIENIRSRFQRELRRKQELGPKNSD